MNRLSRRPARRCRARPGASTCVTAAPASTLRCTRGTLRIEAPSIGLETEALSLRAARASVLLEAAELIGGCWQTVIGALRSFDLVSIMTNGGPFGSSRVLSYYMFEMALGEYGYRMGYGTAIATVLFAIMLVYIVFVLSRIYRQEKDS